MVHRRPQQRRLQGRLTPIFSFLLLLAARYPVPHPHTHPSELLQSSVFSSVMHLDTARCLHQLLHQWKGGRQQHLRQRPQLCNCLALQPVEPMNQHGCVSSGQSHAYTCP